MKNMIIYFRKNRVKQKIQINKYSCFKIKYKMKNKV